MSRSASKDISVEIYATGWGKALARPIRIDVVSEILDAPPPQTISVEVRPTRPKVASLTFATAGDDAGPLPLGAAGSKPPRPAAQRRATRIRPPEDAIKLKDRLYYLLQPPLETILASSTCRLPFAPFPYQYEGIAFLYPRFAAVLADEMGLGKTMQAITAIRLLLRSGELRRVLLICPKPLVSNWQREFETWAGEIPLCVIGGDRQLRAWQWLSAQSPVKIANYELLMRDREFLVEDKSHFDLVVLDEAQRIKNRSSTTSQIVRSIPRSRSWALTGTPVENSTDDLVGIFDFLAPGYLHTGMQARHMAKAAGDYILRRTKEMVLTDLPPKLFRDAEIDLAPAQWDSYRSAEEDGVVRLEHMGRELTIQHVFELVLRLKQICNFDPLSGDSSKLERLEADLEEVAASGKKAIVFSQWVATLERIRERLMRYRPLEYHGQIPAKRREGVIEQFRSDPRSHVILMSYGAGSVGLNLQFCEYVFLFDRWWNPAVEDQAINRAHRIGAAGPVTVTRMLTLGTIEERINQVLAEKRQLSEMILGQAESPQNLGMTQAEIFGLFDLKIPEKRGDAA